MSCIVILHCQHVKLMEVDDGLTQSTAPGRLLGLLAPKHSPGLAAAHEGVAWGMAYDGHTRHMGTGMVACRVSHRR
jgi:hypothetical protein